MTDAQMAARSIMAFIASLGIIFLTARILGEQRKAAWFKKREKSTLFTRRGFLGDSWNFGVPRNWQGVLVALWMVGSISLIGYGIVFLL